MARSILGSKKLVAFVATSTPAKAKKFYGATLGLRLIDENPFALVFDAHGTLLRVTRVEKVVVAGYTVLGWEVSDIAGMVSRLRQAGVKFQRYGGMGQDRLGIWHSPSGAKVAWFKDPDGNTLSVTEVER